MDIPHIHRTMCSQQSPLSFVVKKHWYMVPETILHCILYGNIFRPTSVGESRQHISRKHLSTALVMMPSTAMLLPVRQVGKSHKAYPGRPWHFALGRRNSMCPFQTSQGDSAPPVTDKVLEVKLTRSGVATCISVGTQLGAQGKTEVATCGSQTCRCWLQLCPPPPPKKYPKNKKQ